MNYETAKKNIYVMINKLKAYFKITKIQLKFNLVYKVDFWFSLVAMFLKVLMVWFLWNSLYINANDQNFAFSLNNMLLYSVVGIGLNSTLNTGVTKKFNALINKGDIILMLLQPQSLQLRCLAIAIGDVINNLVLKFSIVFIASMIVFKLNISVITIQSFLLFLVLLFLGFIIIFLIDYICGLICFWTTQVWGINYAKKQLIFIFSGAFIPLWMFPMQFQIVLKHTPFPYIFSLPLEVLIGKINQAACVEAIMIQILWIVILFIVSRILWRLGSRIIFVQGG